MDQNLRPLAEYIGELKDEALDKRIATVDDNEYFCNDIGQPSDIEHLIELSKVVKSATVETKTLLSIVDYYDKESGFDTGDTFIHVVSPRCVTIEKLELLANGSRDRLLRALYELPGHHFNKWLEVDEFAIWLLSGFEESDDQKILLSKIAKGVKFEAARQVNDDGVSVQFKETRGTTGLDWGDDFSPQVVLRPRRTFPEVEEQPECLCIFRAKGVEGTAPHLRLIEGDGGGSARLGIEAIGKWFEGKLPEDVPVLR